MLGEGWTEILGLVYKVWYIECLAKGDLLYSTRNSTQYSVIISMGKESEKEWMCVYLSLNHFVIQQTLSQHYKSTILQ